MSNVSFTAHEPPQNGTRPLVVLDCDATSIREEVIELLAEAAGTRDEVAEITAAAMRGELDFAESLRARVATLAGTPASVCAEAAKRVTFSPGFADLVRAVHARRGVVGVVSGGFLEVLDRIMPDAGVDVWHANRLEVSEGKLTGKLTGEIVDAAAKARTLRAWANQHGIDMRHTIAVGDGANDLAMLAEAAISVGFQAKPIVRERAQHLADDSLAEVTPLLSSFDGE